MESLTEAKFVEFINRMPVMEEKLDRLLFALQKIVDSNSLMGIKPDENGYFEYSEEKSKEDEIKLANYRMMTDEAKELQRQADEIGRELGI